MGELNGLGPMSSLRRCKGPRWVPTTESSSSTCLPVSWGLPAPERILHPRTNTSCGTIRFGVPTGPGPRSSHNGKSDWRPPPRNHGSRNSGGALHSASRGLDGPGSLMPPQTLSPTTEERSEFAQPGWRTKSTDREVASQASISPARATRVLRDFSRAYLPRTSRNGGLAARDNARIASATRAGSPG